MGKHIKATETSIPWPELPTSLPMELRQSTTRHDYRDTWRTMPKYTCTLVTWELYSALNHAQCYNITMADKWDIKNTQSVTERV